jgi:hypothetical protein
MFEGSIYTVRGLKCVARRNGSRLRLDFIEPEVGGFAKLGTKS